MRKLWLGPAMVGLLCAVAGCSADDDDGTGAGRPANAGAGAAGTNGSAAGAGGASGVAPSTQLGVLSAADRQKLCTWAGDLPGVGMEKACPDGSTVEVEVLGGAECVASLDETAGCEATVARLEGCVLAQLHEACELFVAECDRSSSACSSGGPAAQCFALIAPSSSPDS